MKKYIVYCTTNIINNKIYVGVHGTENPDIFDGYIGNSINIFKSNPELKYPKIPFHKAVKKYGYNAFKRQILATFETEEEALDLEGIIVNENFIKRNDTYNIILGGGLPPLHNKIIYQYSLQGEFIQEWKSITEAANNLEFSNAAIGLAAKYNRTAANFLWSFSKIERLDLTLYNIYNPKIPVYVYDYDGNFIKSFESINQCSKNFNVTLSRIQRAIQLGNTVNNYNFSTTLSSKFIKPTFNKIIGDFHQYDLFGNYIRSYESNKQLKEFGFYGSDINKAIKLGRPYKDFIWIRGEKLDSVPSQISKLNKPKKIGQYTKDNRLIKIFNTVREARKEFPNVSKVLNGTATHCHNYIFKYIS